MSGQTFEQPKAFISYSWTSPEHENWVLELAKDLADNGVHVIIDKWDLREGADKFAFMEKMVTDESIRKVIIVCDQVYAEKADGRHGGVGTETQIISREVYEQVDATDRSQKFVAVIAEKDENGKAYIPTYLKPRIYIDLSDSGLWAENFEKLVRWIFDKPLHQRPEIGKPPTYLLADEKINLRTASRFRQAVDAVKAEKPSTIAIVDDYFNTFSENLEFFRIKPEKDVSFDEQVIESINSFSGYRDEVVDLFFVIAGYRSDAKIYGLIHRFFELLLSYLFRPADKSSWQDTDFDNFKFIVHELFLYAITVFLKKNRFEAANELLSQGYLLPSNYPYGNEIGLVDFPVFCPRLESLDFRKQRLKLNRLSLHADLLKERATRTDIRFDELMQTDFILYLRDQITCETSTYATWNWYPDTLVYAASRYAPFEIFARAESIRYFEKLKPVLGVETKEKLIELISEFSRGEREAPRWQHERIIFERLIKSEKIATRA